AIGDGRDVDNGVGEVDPLGAFEHAAHGAVEAELVVVLVGDDETKQAVLDVDAVPDLDVVDEVRVGAGDAALAAGDRGALDDQLIAGVDVHAAGTVFIGDGPEADFGAAQIAQDGDGVRIPRRGLADVAQHQQVIFQRAVGEVESADVGAGLEEMEERLHVPARGPEGGEDFGANHSA